MPQVKGPTGRCDGRDGTFTVGIPDGVYDLELAGLSADAYIAQMTGLDGQVLGEGIPVYQDGTVEILLSQAGAVLEGFTKNPDGQRAADTIVVFVPAPPMRGAGHLYRSSISDVNGSFEIRGIAPGPYHLFAWNEVRGAEYKNEAFLKKFEDKGQAATIEKGRRLVIDVTLADPKSD